MPRETPYQLPDFIRSPLRKRIEAYAHEDGRTLPKMILFILGEYAKARDRKKLIDEMKEK